MEFTIEEESEKKIVLLKLVFKKIKIICNSQFWGTDNRYDHSK